MGRTELTITLQGGPSRAHYLEQNCFKTMVCSDSLPAINLFRKHHLLPGNNGFRSTPKTVDVMLVACSEIDISASILQYPSRAYIARCLLDCSVFAATSRKKISIPEAVALAQSCLLHDGQTAAASHYAKLTVSSAALIIAITAVVNSRPCCWATITTARAGRPHSHAPDLSPARSNAMDIAWASIQPVASQFRCSPSTGSRSMGVPAGW